MNAASLDRPPPSRSLGRWVAGVLPILFGLASLVEGGRNLFGSPETRAAAGQIVPFVLWFNFGSAFAYLAVGLGTLLGHAHVVQVARALAVATLVVFAALGVHILTGGGYETKTVVAMAIRAGFWVVMALALPRIVGQSRAV
jgi:hypothetical protein